mmetsp:Transcript_26017/g.80088  ORF Transcript_26017/g.80088 Transcript_26017/m.80088 type:complete len:238 (+) Transcript_26017:983-1696(+)
MPGCRLFERPATLAPARVAGSTLQRSRATAPVAGSRSSAVHSTTYAYRRRTRPPSTRRFQPAGGSPWVSTSQKSARSMKCGAPPPNRRLRDPSSSAAAWAGGRRGMSWMRSSPSKSSRSTGRGSSTAKARGVPAPSRTSRTQSSSKTGSRDESDLEMPARSQKRRTAAGGTPRRRMAEIVGMRGSAQPSTAPASTSFASLRFDVTVRCRLSRENSICRGNTRRSAASSRPPRPWSRR